MRLVPDEIVRTLSSDGGISVRALVATELVNEAVQRHRASPTAATALGRALMGAVLLASGKKQGETVQLQFRGDGPLGPLTAIAQSDGRVRGFASRPDVDALLEEAAVDVGRAVGAGILSVVRSHPSWKEPYTGIVALESGEIAQDLARYLVDSEQTPSAVALGVILARDGSVEAAGGFLVQALPGAAEEMVELLEENTRNTATPSALIREGLDAEAITDRLLHGIGSRDKHRSRPLFHCGCGHERAAHSARLLDDEEIEALCERGEALEIRCEFCREEYRVGPTELAALRREARAEGAADPAT
jgi:molecular chaperone Hsp33